ncbi:glycosyltransferase family 2 protein [Cellulophaga tyrosinoxydans]|uniref:Glycosyltransferase n=1 Tax=Cellulophaga tyrosinoxydans TaxID=504486 RepID=A0A1W1YQF1_9FLAO|nr:glycosyltransferase family 2 protein [Cellulophaga tyrosinoxydans]SMC38440.1 glycosyltransferase [Cellulophaga tyrosinoxydans]
MKVSIITATYNSFSSLTSCMESVLSQNYGDIEYIIIDGGSKDLTLTKVQHYQAKHKHIKLVSEADTGIYDALNKGVALATGDIIGFVHSDDMLASTTIISELVLVFKTQQADGVYGDLNYVSKTDIVNIIRRWKSCTFSKHLLKKGWMPAHPTLFLKKEVYQKHGYFNLDFKISADYDFMLRILIDESLKFAYLSKIISIMRIGGASNRSLKNILLKSKEDYKAIKKNGIGGVYTLFLKNTSKIKQFFGT